MLCFLKVGPCMSVKDKRCLQGSPRIVPQDHHPTTPTPTQAVVVSQTLYYCKYIENVMPRPPKPTQAFIADMTLRTLSDTNCISSSVKAKPLGM